MRKVPCGLAASLHATSSCSVSANQCCVGEARSGPSQSVLLVVNKLIMTVSNAHTHRHTRTHTCSFRVVTEQPDLTGILEEKASGVKCLRKMFDYGSRS